LTPAARLPDPPETYLIDSIEYIPPVKLPPGTLRDDPDELAALLAETVQSITDQEAT
jgi:hypothetical protein